MNDHPACPDRPSPTRGALVVIDDELPVVFRSWGDWRNRRRSSDRDVPCPPTRDVTTQFCALCWGNGRIFHHAANGEGLIPASCAACDGRGQVIT